MRVSALTVNYVSMFFIPQIALAIRLLSSSLGVGDRGICRSVGVVLLGFSRGFNALQLLWAVSLALGQVTICTLRCLLLVYSLMQGLTSLLQGPVVRDLCRQASVRLPLSHGI